MESIRDHSDVPALDAAAQSPSTIYDIIALQAGRSPNNPAILAPGRSPLTYSRLLALIESTIAQLNDAGVGRGDRVALVSPNGPTLASAFCTIAAGACCAPLNPSYGDQEFEFFLGDIKAAALLVPADYGGAAVHVAGRLQIPVLRLARDPDEIAGTFELRAPRRRAAARPGVACPDDIALLLHTSGTTSRPKLVPLMHRNLAASSTNIGKALGLRETDRCLNVMPLFHIHGLMAAVLASLRAGGSVAATEGFHAVKFFRWMEELEPSWYTAVPTMHQALLAQAESDSGPRVRPLRFVRSSSAALPPKVMTELEDLFAAPVIESYGMTEAAHQMASNPMPPGVRKPGSVGPAAGPEIAILNEAGDFVASGQKGEVAIRGENVMSGYEGNEEANRQAFHNGWFRTGDQGYLDEDGYLFLTGRLKEIINRGGEKISPREVDEVLLEHPSIRQAVTFAVPHAQLGEEIGVAVIPKDNHSVTEREVKQHVAERLADFKIPRVVRIVDSIPKGPTGKLKRIGLAGKLGIEPIATNETIRHLTHVEPQNEAEEVLVRIFRDVLALDAVGVQDDFFAMGGSSLQATTVLERVAASGLGTVSVIDLLDEPTVAGLARRLASPHTQDTLPDGLIAIQPKGSLPPIYCAPGHDGAFLGFASLSQRLGPDQPLIGIDPLATPEDGKLSMRQLATRYLERIRSHRPSGPYRFLGVCFGGKILFEMACQLEAEGEPVGLLALINAFQPRHLRGLERIAEVAKNAVRRGRFHLLRTSGMSVSGMVDYGRQRTQAFVDNSFRPRLLGAGQSRYGIKSRDLDRRRVQSVSILASWSPRKYTGPVALLVDAVPRAGVYPSPQMGWEGIIPGDASLCMFPNDEYAFWTEKNTDYVASIVNQAS